MRRLGALAGLLLVALVVAIPTVYSVLSFPKSLRLLPGQTTRFYLGAGLRLRDDTDPEAVSAAAGGGVAIHAGGVGQERLRLTILGVTLRRATLAVVPEVEVIPGGQSVGVLVSRRGLLVVRTTGVEGPDGPVTSPAEAAGIRPGDVVVAVGPQLIHHPVQLQQLVQAYGAADEAVPLVLDRAGARLDLQVRPVLGRQQPVDRRREPGYVLGLVLEDPAAGVGTLTFWDPKSGVYGALGHPITSHQGGDVLRVEDGRIVNAQIRGISPGQRGKPGEKLGVFDAGGGELGSISQNSDLGIFGHLYLPPPPGLFGRPLPVALADQVKVGPATMLTVLNHDQVEAFDVMIEAVMPQKRPQVKGLVIRVVDPRLLAETGGIVQGMSGSPLIQDGRFVGAVTHVFVNDPTHGFGVLAEWMLDQSGLWAGADVVSRPSAA